jgi:hypothetical protein
MDDSINDALIECVKACGGSKAVGVALWPSKGVEAAQRHLLSCLNPERNEKLGPDEALLIARMAREKGCHAYVEFLAQSLGYAAPVPTEPEDARAQLQREFVAATAALARMAQRIEMLQGRAAA